MNLTLPVPRHPGRISIATMYACTGHFVLPPVVCHGYRLGVLWLETGPTS